MEEIKKGELKNAESKVEEKRNTFMLIYILVGIFGLAVLAMLIYAFIVTR